MKKSILIVFVMAAVLLIIVALCDSDPAKITVEQAAEIARPYFRELYNLDVIVKNVEYKRVGEYKYLNLIMVSDGEMEYNLMLDEQNKPLTDDISAIGRIQNIDITSFGERIKTYGMRLYVRSGFKVVYSTSNRRYIVNCPVELSNIPRKDLKGEIYSLLGELKNEGIDELVVIISTPDFLLPKMEFGHGVHGAELTAEFFSTEISAKEFEEQYCSLADRVSWDIQKFDDKIQELTQLGYTNVYFYNKQGNAATVEIVLYCESDANLSDGPAIELLDEMDDSYFRVGGKETKYTLQHVYNLDSRITQ